MPMAIQLNQIEKAGEGRFDIAVLPMYIDDQAIIIECKHSKNIKELRKDSAKASHRLLIKNISKDCKKKDMKM